MNASNLKLKLEDFIEFESRSCSMEPTLITPEYIYRMWGGMVALEDIQAAMAEMEI